MSSSDTAGSSSALEPHTRGIKRKRDDVLTSKGAKGRKDASEQRKEDTSSSSSDSDSSSDDPDKNEDETSKETQVLSHAAQRKLKKKEQGKANEVEDMVESPAVDLAPKRQHSVWVGNLAFKTTEQLLRAFFQRGVPGCEMTRVHLPTKTGNEVGGGKGMRGENRGFAYVDFTTEEAKGKAIALSEQNLDGRKLLIKDGADFTGRPTAGLNSTTGTTNSAIGKSKTAQRILAAQKQPPAPTLFLGNLGFQATEESIRSMFESHLTSLRQKVKVQKVKNQDEGEEAKVTNEKKWLRKVRMGTFEDSGLCKGWAFIDFFNTEDATTALLDTRNHSLDGRKLVVEYASAEAVRRGGGPGVRAHRDNSKMKGDILQAGNRVRGQAKSEGTEIIKPEAETLDDRDGPPPKKTKTFDGKERERGGKGKRVKPGAALALAKREKVAIVPSSGKKTIF